MESEALAHDIEALSLADPPGEPFAFTILTVVSLATFADFSLPRFVAATGAEPPRGFPAAKLRTQNRGVFSVFPSGKIIHTGLQNEADSHRALVDLARELRYTLAEPPHTANMMCEIPAQGPVDLAVLAKIAHGRHDEDGRVGFWLRGQGIRAHVLVDGTGVMRISHACSVKELRQVAELARCCVTASCVLDRAVADGEDDLSSEGAVDEDEEEEMEEGGGGGGV